MKGAKGDWKQFLSSYDKKFGASLSDPGKRSNDVLTAFLKTFDKEADLKVINKCAFGVSQLPCFDDDRLPV
jgi:RNA exonuclease 1